MKRVLAIDPGPLTSGVVVWAGALEHARQWKNEDLRDALKAGEFDSDICAIEMIACYGMAVGAEVFHTCRWIGRFEEQAKMRTELVYRKDVKLHICGTAKAKDANIRQALIDKHGIPGTRKNPGPLLGISGHLWAALAVADYARDNLMPPYDDGRGPGVIIRIQEATE